MLLRRLLLRLLLLSVGIRVFVHVFFSLIGAAAAALQRFGKLLLRHSDIIEYL